MTNHLLVARRVRGSEAQSTLPGTARKGGPRQGAFRRYVLRTQRTLVNDGNLVDLAVGQDERPVGVQGVVRADVVVVGGVVVVRADVEVVAVERPQGLALRQQFAVLGVKLVQAKLRHGVSPSSSSSSSWWIPGTAHCGYRDGTLLMLDQLCTASTQGRRAS